MVQASQPDTDSSTHTPLPWKVRGGVDDFHLYRIENERTGYIAEITLDGPPTANEANAAFIVRAVNNHAKLLKALDNTLTGLIALAGAAGGTPPPDYHRRVSEATKAIEEAQS